MADPTEEMVVIAFPGEQRAAEVLTSLRQLNHEHLVDLHKAALLTRDANGAIGIHETNDFTSKQGLIGGALAGGLVGLFTKGSTVTDALLGAGAGYLAGKVVDLGFPDAWLKEVAQTLQPGTSAIVAALQFAHVDQAVQTLSQFHGGTIIRQTLPADVAAKLQTALQG
jgi:uncharacterized membrane protein